VNTKSNDHGPAFQFQTGNGKLLIDEIAYIERLATERLRVGVEYQSIQFGALVLLKMAIEGATGRPVGGATNEIAIQACTVHSNSPRCTEMKR
jgi:hypothetical protein